MKIGVQFYTLRKQCADLESFSESLKKVADMGYTTVQISGVCDYEPQWLADELKKNGLSCVLTHIKKEKLLEMPAEIARDHHVFGCRNVGLGAMPNAASLDEEVYGAFVRDYMPVAKTLQENGCKFFYHHHGFEFARGEDGRIYMDRLLEDFSPDLLGITYDTYWAQYGGADPAEYLKKLRGRTECIHLKDMTIVGKEQRFAPIGLGNINFDRVLTVAEDLGTKYLLVEQDNCYDEDPFVCLKKSYDYLTSLGLS